MDQSDFDEMRALIGEEPKLPEAEYSFDAVEFAPVALHSQDQLLKHRVALTKWRRMRFDLAVIESFGRDREEEAPRPKRRAVWPWVVLALLCAALSVALLIA